MAGITPWLPVAANYPTRNVARQQADPTSILNLYRTLTRIRRVEPALHAGDYTSVETGSTGVFAYLRTAENADRFLVVLNFGGEVHTLNLSQVGQ